MVKDFNSEESVQELMSTDLSKGLYVLDFYGEGCIPCRTLGKLIAEELEPKYGQKVNFFKISVSYAWEIAAHYKIRGVPYVLFIKDGVVVERTIGLHPKEVYHTILDNLVNNGEKN